MISINQDRLVRQFMQFVQIDSPSFEEAPFGSALAEELRKLGLAVENDRTGKNGAGNLLGVVPGTNRSLKPILLAMHTDTVEPGRGVKPRLEAGQIRSDGSTILGADNKSAIAASLEVIRWLQSSRPEHGDVELLFSWGEERGHLGAKALDTSRLRSRIGFVPDGGGPLGTIIHRAPYYDSLRAVFIGKAAHAGISPEKGISAIVMASQAIGRMKLGRIDEETTANLGKISGGSGRNTVPERVEVEGEARSLILEQMEHQVQHLRSAMEEAAREAGGKVEVQVKREYDGFSLGKDELPVKIALAASRAVGLTPTVASTNGGSDANEFNPRGIQTLVLGMGGSGYHSTQESIAVDELVKLAEWIGALVVEAGKNR
jgi:tripeptide aminopeptidase